MCKRWGDKIILNDFNYTFARYEKLGIVGDNGVGKSTFIKLLLSQVQPDSGEFEIGETVKFGYYSQEGMKFDEGKKVIDAIRDIAEHIYFDEKTHYSASQFLQLFLFSPSDQQKLIAKLSGGEKRRLYLASVLIHKPNFLILDEPTNDLDTDMLAVMEDLLDTWPGTLIVVSHDRYLLERVTDQQFALIGGKIRHLPGGVQDYLDMTEAIKNGKDPFADEKTGKAGKASKGGNDAASASVVGDSSSVSADGDSAAAAPKLTGKAFHEASKRVAAIERKLAKLEEQKADLEAQMAAHDPSDYEGLGKLNEQLQAVTDESESLEMEWMELSEQLE